jgi:hypothetical protein
MPRKIKKKHEHVLIFIIFKGIIVLLLYFNVQNKKKNLNNLFFSLKA